MPDATAQAVSLRNATIVVVRNVEWFDGADEMIRELSSALGGTPVVVLPPDAMLEAYDDAELLALIDRLSDVVDERLEQRRKG